MNAVFFIVIFILLVLGASIHYLINEGTKRKQIQALVDAGNETLILSQMNSMKWTFILGGIVAFSLSVTFVLSYMTGEDLKLIGTWKPITWLYFLVGILLTLFVTIKQGHLYLDVNGGWAVGLITAVFVTFAVMSEVTNPMESSDRKVRQRSIDSPTYQAAIAAIGSTGNQTSAYSSLLADAESELAKDKVYLGDCNSSYKSAKKVSNCQKINRREIAQDKALITSYQRQMQDESSRNETGKLAMVDKAKSLENNDKHQNAFVRLLMTALDCTAEEANLIIALIVITTFEIGFHYAGIQVAVRREALIELGNEDITYAEEVKRQRKAAAFKQKIQQLRDENMTTGNNGKPDIKIKNSNYPTPDFEPATQLTQSNKTVKTSPNEIKKKPTVQQAKDCTRTEALPKARTVNKPRTADVARTEVQPKKTVQKSTVQQEKHCTRTDVQQEQRTVNKLRTVDVERTDVQVKSTVQRETVQQPKSPSEIPAIYEQYKLAIASKQLKITARERKTYLSKLFKQHAVRRDIKEIQRIADHWLDKIFTEESFLIKNPKYSEGKRVSKYVVV